MIILGRREHGGCPLMRSEIAVRFFFLFKGEGFWSKQDVFDDDDDVIRGWCDRYEYRRC